MSKEFKKIDLTSPEKEMKEFLKKDRGPFIVLMNGHCGAGMSMASRELARNFSFLCREMERKERERKER